MFKSDVNLNTRELGHFILKSDEMCHFPRSPLPLIMHDRVMAFESCFAFIELEQICPLAIMHENCLIDGLRAKSFSHLSLCDNKEGKQYKQLVRIHCFTLCCSMEV